VERGSPGLDAGTTAHVRLPQQPFASDRSARDDAALAGLSGRREVVEDDRDAAEMLDHILEDRGAQMRIMGDQDGASLAPVLCRKQAARGCGPR
jgi:hypothetical protein